MLVDRELVAARTGYDCSGSTVVSGSSVVPQHLKKNVAPSRASGRSAHPARARKLARRDLCAGPVRRAVFVEEQAVPLAGEFDAEDRTCRTSSPPSRGSPPGPFAGGASMVPGSRWSAWQWLQAFSWCRGRRRIDARLARLDEAGVPQTVMHAQLRARVFYQRLGYVVRGEPFEEEGIVHIEMERTRPL